MDPKPKISGLRPWIDDAAHRRPDHPFLIGRTAAMTFAQLAGHIDDPNAAPPDEFVRGLTILRPLASGAAVSVDTGEICVEAEAGDALIVPTSGSTGAPKRVRITYANIEASAAASATHLHHDNDDRWLCALPLHHVGGLMILLRSLRQATTVLLEPSFDTARTADMLHGGEATIGSLVPTMLHRILEEPTNGPYRCRAVLIGGGPSTPDLLDRARLAGIPALPTYGMTETTSQVATALPHGDGSTVLLPTVELRSPGGVVEVAGPMVSPGYLGESPRAERWFTTGDLGSIEDGRLTIHGRADEVIITGGEKVQPETVEHILYTAGWIDEVCVVGSPDAEWGSIVVAVYTGNDVGPVPEELARHQVPKRWIQVDALPRTDSGKIDRRGVESLAS